MQRGCNRNEIHTLRCDDGKLLPTLFDSNRKFFSCQVLISLKCTGVQWSAFMRHEYFMRFHEVLHRGNETTHMRLFECGYLVLCMWPWATLFLKKRSRSYEDQSDRFQRVGIENQESCPHGPGPLVDLCIPLHLPLYSGCFSARHTWYASLVFDK